MWPIHANQLTCQGRMCGECLMDTICQSREVLIASADNDAGVRRTLPMQADKMPTVEGNDRPAVGGGECKHGRIARSVLTGFLDRNHFMPKLAQLEHDGIVEILIRIEAS